MRSRSRTVENRKQSEFVNILQGAVGSILSQNEPSYSPFQLTVESVNPVYLSDNLNSFKAVVSVHNSPSKDVATFSNKDLIGNVVQMKNWYLNYYLLEGTHNMELALVGKDTVFQPKQNTSLARKMRVEIIFEQKDLEFIPQLKKLLVKLRNNLIKDQGREMRQKFLKKNFLNFVKPSVTSKPDVTRCWSWRGNDIVNTHEIGIRYTQSQPKDRCHLSDLIAQQHVSGSTSKRPLASDAAWGDASKKVKGVLGSRRAVSKNFQRGGRTSNRSMVAKNLKISLSKGGLSVNELPNVSYDLNTITNWRENYA